MDSVGFLTPLPSPPSRSRLCMVCGKSGNENHVYIVDVVIDESALGDTHKIPPRAPPVTPVYTVDPADLSAYLETTPNIVLVDFPLIEVCALDSVLYFFPQSPSTDVLSLELPSIGTSLNRHRVVYGEDGSMLKKAPRNLLAPKDFPIATRYGTRFLVFSTQSFEIGRPSSSYGAGDQFEIYDPCSEAEAEALPNLIILRGSSYGGYELYNIETQSSKPFYSSVGIYENRVHIEAYTLIDHTFVVRTNFGRFFLDLENPKVRGWERIIDCSRIIMDAPFGDSQIYMTQNWMTMEGIRVCNGTERDKFENLPRSFIPIPFNKHTKFSTRVMLLDSFKYPRCTPCILQTQCQSD